MSNLIPFFSGPFGLITAVILIFLAGLSEGVGARTSVLLINRTTPIAFVLSLLIAALLFLFSAVVWIGGVWLAATSLFGLNNALLEFFYGLSVAYTPFLFSALALLPLVGPLLRVLLRLWSFAIGVAVLLPLGLTLGQVVLSAAAGALLVTLVGWLLSESAAFVGRRLWAGMTHRVRPSLSTTPPWVIPGYTPSNEEAA
jgi:hypothetical protein